MQSVTRDTPWIMSPCLLNFFNYWKKKCDKMKYRKWSGCFKNIQSSLILTPRAQDRPRGVLEGRIVEDNVAIENQVKLVAFKNVGLTIATSSSPVSSNDDLTSQEGGRKRKLSRECKCSQSSKSSSSFRSTGGNTCKFCKKESQTDCRKSVKRQHSHSEEYKHTYKKINWDDWTLGDPPKTRPRGKQRGKYTNKPLLTTHHELSLERLSRLYFDYDDSEEPGDTDEHKENEENPSDDCFYSNEERDAFISNFNVRKLRSYSDSLKSFHGSNRCSLNSTGSLRSNQSSPVPMNFIPGQTKPMIMRAKSEEKSENKPFANIQNATFCYKGVTCQVARSYARTHKALAHTGMMVISLSAPSTHKCAC